MFTSNLPNHTLGKSTGLLPFGLFTHVKEGHLHPLDKNGEPIPPPVIEYQLKHQRELEETINVLPLEYGKIETLYRGEAKEAEKKKLDKRKESLQKEYKDLKHKLDAIKDKYSWTGYELPQEPMKRQKVFDWLQSSYFHNRELQNIGGNDKTNNIPGDTSLIETPAEVTQSTPDKETQKETANTATAALSHISIVSTAEEPELQDISGKETAQQEPNKELYELIKSVGPEAAKLYSAIKSVGFKGLDIEIKLQDRAKDELKRNPAVYSYIKSKHLNKKLFALTTGQEKRDFIGNLLQIIAKERKFKMTNYQKMYQTYASIFSNHK